MEARAMPEWEYRKIDLNVHRPQGDELELLNTAGAGGWELVGIASNNIAYLKREVEEIASTQTTAAAGKGEPEHVNANRNDERGAGAQVSTVKYRDPVTRETWSGRGRMPNWLKRKMEGGEDLKDYLV